MRITARISCIGFLFFLGPSLFALTKENLNGGFYFTEEPKGFSATATDCFPIESTSEAKWKKAGFDCRSTDQDAQSRAFFSCNKKQDKSPVVWIFKTQKLCESTRQTFVTGEMP